MVIDEDVRKKAASVAKRVMNRMEDISVAQEDIRNLYTEAKDAGLDVKGLKSAVKYLIAEERNPGAIDEMRNAEEAYVAAIEGS